MDLENRISNLENELGDKNYWVINIYPHLTKAECIKEYEAGNEELYPSHLFRKCTKVNLNDPIYWITVLPDYFQYEQIQWLDKYEKEINNLLDNHNYSLNRIYDEFYEKGF